MLIWNLRFEYMEGLPLTKKKKKTKFVKPHIAYTFTTSEKIAFCKFLKSVNFPNGFAISRCVSVNDGKLWGLKCHAPPS